jgi:hypothetical protein
MRVLEGFEVMAVSGGDHWGYENSDGGVDEDRSASYSNSYQSSTGTWGSGSAVSQVCGTFGNAVEAGLGIAKVPITVAWPIGQSAEAWCTQGFPTPTRASGGYNPSNFGGGGAGGRWQQQAR